MSKVIITGVNGFVGCHLAKEFKDQGVLVIGVGHDSKASEEVKDHLEQYVSCDLTNDEEVFSKINLADVNALIHLAGLSNQGQSFDNPKKFITDNTSMAINLLEHGQRSKSAARFVMVSTGAVYSPSQSLPLNEDSVTAPGSPYAVSKLLAEEVTSYYATRGIDAVSVRPLNHTGPGQGEGFLLPDLYKQIMNARETGERVLHVGNIDTRRDYTDVRDVVKAYSKLALAEKLENTLYNVCSNKSISGREMLELLLATMSERDMKIEVDQSKIRPTDVKEIIGDATRLRKELGWEPTFSLEQTVKDFVESKK